MMRTRKIMRKRQLKKRKRTMALRPLQTNLREELHRTTMKVISSMMTESSMRKMAQ